MPHFGHAGTSGDFLEDFLFAELSRLRETLGEAYPRVFVILGNDDGRAIEESFIEAADSGSPVVHAREEGIFRAAWTVYGYSFTPPSPFLLKDWERYDVSRYVDPGCVSPEEGWRTVDVDPDEARFATIAQDLEEIAGSNDLANAVFLFHAPPHKSNLDRAALDGKTFEHAPLDVHVGSIAIRRFIETRQPLLTLHGHVHESARITGSWRDCVRAHRRAVRGARRARARARALRPRESRRWPRGSCSSQRHCLWENQERFFIGRGRAASVTAPILTAKLVFRAISSSVTKWTSSSPPVR